MDIKAKFAEAVDKPTKDEQTPTLFKEDPVKAVEKVLGVDLPDDVVDRVIQGVNAKLAGEKIGGALGSLKKRF